MFVDQPMSFRKPPADREYTELVPEPSFFLEVNYMSDGEVEAIELPSTVRFIQVL